MRITELLSGIRNAPALDNKSKGMVRSLYGTIVISACEGRGNDIAKGLVEDLKHNGEDYKDVAVSLGVSSGMISDVANGKKTFGLATRTKLFEIYRPSAIFDVLGDVRSDAYLQSVEYVARDVLKSVPVASQRRLTMAEVQLVERLLMIITRGAQREDDEWLLTLDKNTVYEILLLWGMAIVQTRSVLESKHDEHRTF